MIELSSNYIMTVRRKALRGRVWFRFLDAAERAILRLVPRCVDKVRSPRLIDIVAKIIAKISEALRSPLERFRSQVAKPFAEKISLIASKWGNRSAGKWADDLAFIQWIAVNKFNDISMFR